MDAVAILLCLTSVLPPFDQPEAADPVAQEAPTLTLSGPPLSENDYGPVSLTSLPPYVPFDWRMYLERGRARRAQGDLDGAIADYTFVIGDGGSKNAPPLALNSALPVSTNFYGRPTQSDEPPLFPPLAPASSPSLPEPTALPPLTPTDALPDPTTLVGQPSPSATLPLPVLVVPSVPSPTDVAEACLERGDIWIEKKEYDKAIADCTAALRLFPEYAAALGQRGRAWSEKKEHDRALADYDEALRLDPRYAPALTDRGYIRLLKRDVDQAIEDFNEAIRLAPGDKEVFSGTLQARSPVSLTGPKLNSEWGGHETPSPTQPQPTPTRSRITWPA